MYFEMEVFGIEYIVYMDGNGTIHIDSKDDYSVSLEEKQRVFECIKSAIDELK